MYLLWCYPAIHSTPPTSCKQTVNKAKASDKITFPVTLDLGQVIARAQRSQPPFHSGVTQKSGEPNEPIIPHNTSQSLPINPNISSASPPSTHPLTGGVEPKPRGDMEIDGGAVQGGQFHGVRGKAGLAVLEGLLRGADPGINPAAGGRYNLTAVIIHKGSSASQGHYGRSRHIIYRFSIHFQTCGWKFNSRISMLPSQIRLTGIQTFAAAHACLGPAL